MTAPAPATVVVATYGRPRQIRACLRRLLALDHPDFRIVVVDDGSPEPVAPIAAPFGPRVRVLRQENAGPAAARNRGVEAAETEFVALTDDDCAPEPDWLTRLQAAHAEAPEALLGGRVVNRLEGNLYAAASQALCDHLYDWRDAGEAASSFFTTNNVGFSRRVFLELGGFDRRFRRAAGEDRDLGLRWRASGRPLRGVPDAVVGHLHDLRLASFLRQQANYGRGAFRLHQTMDERGDGRRKLAAFRFYRDLVLRPLRHRDGASAPAALAQSALLALAQVATAWGYAAERAETRRGAAFPRPGGASSR